MFIAATFNASTLFSRRNCALVATCHGSPKTQNIQDAIAHAQSRKPLACSASQQMPPVREHHPLAHCVPVVRLLPRTTGTDS